MSKKMGRPKLENPKDVEVKVRITTDMNNKLLDYSKKNHITRAEAIRNAIDKILRE